MTKGMSETELDPSEEFPILYHLLTSPMTGSEESTGKRKHKYPGGSSSKDAKVLRIEADSSTVVSDSDTSCCSDDDDDCCDEEDYSMASASEDEDMHICSCSRLTGNVILEPQGSKSSSIICEPDDEPEEGPSSTTVDDEDVVDELVIKREQAQQSRRLPH